LEATEKETFIFSFSLDKFQLLSPPLSSRDIKAESPQSKSIRGIKIFLIYFLFSVWTVRQFDQFYLSIPSINQLSDKTSHEKL